MTSKTKFRIYLLVLSVILLSGIVLILLPGQRAVLMSIGTSLVASGVVGFLTVFYESIVGDDKATMDAILESGVIGIYNRRDLDKYHSLMDNVSNQIDIAGYSLRAFFESFGTLLADRAQKDERLMVRFLIVDPTSERSRERERLEGHAPGTFSGTIGQISRAFSGFPNVQIRALNGDLSTMVFRLDNVMFVGPQLLSRPSRSSATLGIAKRKHSWLFDVYELEFEAMWKSSHDLPAIPNG